MKENSNPISHTTLLIADECIGADLIYAVILDKISKKIIDSREGLILVQAFSEYKLSADPELLKSLNFSGRHIADLTCIEVDSKYTTLIDWILENLHIIVAIPGQYQKDEKTGFLSKVISNLQYLKLPKYKQYSHELYLSNPNI